MFARETKEKYDPSSSPIIERPLTDRPLSDRVQQNPFTRLDSTRKENHPFKSPEKPVHRRMESKTEIFDTGDAKAFAAQAVSTSPIKDYGSPKKSSLTANSRYAAAAMFDPENGTWSGEEEDARASTPRGSLRPAKSVTFQSAPPEIKEYEQQTPEPSSLHSGSRESSYDSEEFEENNFERASSAEDDDSFDASLEDTEKTPVVLPGDWTHASPETARTELVDDFDDVFDDGAAGSPPLSATPSRMLREPQISVRSESVTSDDSIRPLPPLPPVASPGHSHKASDSLTAGAERASSAQRTLPSPPGPTSVSKSELLRIGGTTMSLEDRMNLLSVHGSGRAAMDTSALMGDASEDAAGEDDTVADLPDLEYAPMKISRESILRKVKSDRAETYNDEEREESESLYSNQEIDYSDLAKVDPDTAIPSRENSTHFDPAIAALIKDEPDDAVLDLNSLPALSYAQAMADISPSQANDHERESSILHHGLRASADESESHYSSPDYSADSGMQDKQGMGLGISNEETFSTPMEEPIKRQDPSLPLLTSLLAKDDYDFGLKEYMTPSPPQSRSDAGNEKASKPTMGDIPHLAAASLRSPPASEHDEETESVMSGSNGAYDEPRYLPFVEAPVIPERKATIKTGGKLKARPSGTPADFEAVIASLHEEAKANPMPSIPDQYRAHLYNLSDPADAESLWSQPSAASSGESKNDSAVEQEPKGRNTRDLKLNLDLANGPHDMGLSFTEEMDRVMETQKVVLPPPSHAVFSVSLQAIQKPKTFSFRSEPSSAGTAESMAFPPFSPHARTGTNGTIRTQKGYLMRQNTKVVVASNRNISNESRPPMSPRADSKYEGGSRSPRKASNGEKFMTTEPWNGRIRRKSQRQSDARRSNVCGPAPPLPGQESALGVVDEYSTIDAEDEETERGRLFVKVVGVKDLQLPLPRSKSFSPTEVMRLC